MTIIKAQDLSYKYDNSTFSINNVNFDINAGEILGIIGPNGSGKSTLLKCISGQIKPDDGFVNIEDINVLDLSTKVLSKKMSLIQQHFAIEYQFTVIEIVLMGRNPFLKRFESYTENDYEVAINALKRVEILHLKDRDVTTLSGGEWQRMVIARALCQEAPIMLLDEPVTGLDIKHQVQLMQIINQLSSERKLTVVCVLHNLNLAQHYCDKVLIMKNGKMVKLGKPDKIMEKGLIESVYETKVNKITYENKTYIIPQYNG